MILPDLSFVKFYLYATVDFSTLDSFEIQLELGTGPIFS